MADLENLFQMLWQDYAGMNKQAGVIHDALEARGEKVVNDHVAFRTFDLPETSIDIFARPFLELGYQVKGDPYLFREKKLIARHFEHPGANAPKVFISALKVNELSHPAREIITGLVRQIPSGWFKDNRFLIGGTPWHPVAGSVYEQLLEESEYAGWMAAFGFRVNHFTVFFNHLSTFKDLPDLNGFIKSLGYKLNASGGEIKGTPDVFLEQSSTLAHQVKVKFADREMTVPGCYYEFARRYEMPQGGLFQGFVTQSADKIFESTDRKD